MTLRCWCRTSRIAATVSCLYCVCETIYLVFVDAAACAKYLHAISTYLFTACFTLQTWHYPNEHYITLLALTISYITKRGLKVHAMKTALIRSSMSATEPTSHENNDEKKRNDCELACQSRKSNIQIIELLSDVYHLTRHPKYELWFLPRHERYMMRKRTHTCLSYWATRQLRMTRHPYANTWTWSICMTSYVIDHVSSTLDAFPLCALENEGALSSTMLHHCRRWPQWYNYDEVHGELMVQMGATSCK